MGLLGLLFGYYIKKNNKISVILLFDITLRKIIDKTIPWRGKG